MECRHGVEVRTTKVWNEACDRCRKEQAAYDRQTRRVGGELTARYRAGEFDRVGTGEDHLRGQKDALHPPVAPAEKQMLEAGHGFVRTLMHPFGRTSTERRVSKRLHKVRWALEFAADGFTPAQRQALAMVYGCELTPSKAASALRIKKQEFLDRLTRGEETVDELYDAKKMPRLREKRGRPNAKITEPERGVMLEAEAFHKFGPDVASYVRDGSGRGFHDHEPDLYERLLAEEKASRLRRRWPLRMRYVRR